MDDLHWQHLLSRVSIGESKRHNARDNAGDSDTYCTCLGHLG